MIIQGIISVSSFNYSIDSYGNISKRRGEGFIRTLPNRNGYLVFTTKDDKGRTVNYFVHRLVYETFVGEIPEGMTIDHIDGNKLNNHITNLQLLPLADNVIKAQALNWKFVSPIGLVVEIYNLKEFCRENYLCLSSMWKVHHRVNNRRHHKGWTRYEEV